MTPTPKRASIQAATGPVERILAAPQVANHPFEQAGKGQMAGYFRCYSSIEVGKAGRHARAWRGHESEKHVEGALFKTRSDEPQARWSSDL